MNDKIWTTSEGKKIKIKDLSDKHLINIINMLERNAYDKIPNFSCSDFQGEIAQFCTEQEMNTSYEDPLSALDGTIYDDLWDEAIKRKLQWGNER